MKIVGKSALNLLVVALMSVGMPHAQAATLTCSKGTAVKTVKGKSTMLYKGKRVACQVAKPAPTPTPAVTFQNNVRISTGSMNDALLRPNLTITIRNTTSKAYTVVVVGTEISVLTPANDISAFISPSKPGTYQMYLLEEPTIKATLTVVP